MRKLGIALAAVAVTAIASATPAAAQRLGSRLQKDQIADGRKYSEDLAAQTAQSLVVCLVARHGKQAEEMLLTGDEKISDKGYRALMRQAGNTCPMLGDASPVSSSVGFSFPKDVFRGLVAERLLMSKLDTLGAMPVLPVQMAYSRPWFALSGRDVTVNEMAVCLAESDPAGTAALFRTKPYTPQEMTAIGNLGPAMQKCLRVGVKLKANRQTLRAALAEGAFNRLALPPITYVTPPVKL
jgi:hypothetical protein